MSNVKTTFVNSMTPARVAKLIEAARRTPFAISAARVDLSNDCPNEVVKKMPVQVMLALVMNQCKSRDGIAIAHILQRDTVKRLMSRTKTAHLRSKNGRVPAAQRLVQLVSWNGNLQTLDATHRISIWGDASESCAIPATVDVIIHYPKTEEVYNLLYDCIDSKKQTKSTVDNLYGALNNAKVPQDSPLFRSRKIGTAITLVAGCSTDPGPLREAVVEWRKELTELNNFQFPSNNKSFSQGVWWGYLKLLRSEVDRGQLQRFTTHLRTAREMRGIVAPASITEFLNAYNTAEGHSSTFLEADRDMLLKAFRDYAAQEEAAQPKSVKRKRPTQLVRAA